MSYFDEAIHTVLEHEGGYVDDPNDPGGATNWGISIRLLKTLDGDFDYDNDGDIDADDIKALKQESAIGIYWREFWDKYQYEEIRYQAVATKVFDLCVNMGPRSAHKCLQRALMSASPVHLKIDGIIGPKTLGAVNMAMEQSLLSALRSEAACFYRMLITKKPQMKKYENGWMRRARA